MRMQFTSCEDHNDAISGIMKSIAEECDLLIVFGSSHVNGPILQLIKHSTCPKVLVNKTNLAGVGLDFEAPCHPDRLLWKSSGDDFAKEITEHLGLTAHMQARIDKANGL